MQFDTGTLMVVGAVTAGLSGLWLGSVWLHRRDVTALAWWAAANLVYAVAIVGLRIALADQDPLLLQTGLILSTLPPGFVWAGARSFRGARVPIPLVAAGSIVVVAALVAGAVFTTGPLVSATGFLVWIAYLAAAVFELWRGRDEELPARWPLAFLLLIHAAVYAGGIADVLGGGFVEMDGPPLDSWFGLIHFEGILYAMGTAVLMSGLAAERAESRFRTAASEDPLTGAASRRAFFERGERLLLRAATSRTPASAIVFDLDRFKAVNDTYGHQVGDRVLRTFAATAREVLRPDDLFGRHGGEEFAVILPGEGVDTAYAVAERIRRAFAEAARMIDAAEVAATVSAGVTLALPDETLERVLAAADRALYRAKAQGRNCVRRADGPPDEGGSNVIRVA